MSPAPRSTTALREQEFHDLIGKVGAVEQFRRWTDADVDDDLDRERRERLAELSDLLNPTDSKSHPAEDAPLWDVETAIERWHKTHPLTLTGATMVKVIRDASPDPEYPGNGMAIAMTIGDPRHGGRYYPLYAEMFADVGNGHLQFVLPDAIAEEFRQQGRRAIQREFADLMAAESHR